jgi:hypothetical protein
MTYKCINCDNVAFCNITWLGVYNGAISANVCESCGLDWWCKFGRTTTVEITQPKDTNAATRPE